MKRITIVLFIFSACFWSGACAPQKLEVETPPVVEVAAKPNPLTIRIDLSAKGHITLHSGGNKPEEMGTVENTSRLTDRLKTIFQEREREAHEERTVFIKSPKNIKYGLVVKTIDAAKIAGAAPIGLQVDDLGE